MPSTICQGCTAEQRHLHEYRALNDADTDDANIGDVNTQAVTTEYANIDDVDFSWALYQGKLLDALRAGAVKNSQNNPNITDCRLTKSQRLLLGVLCGP